MGPEEWATRYEIEDKVDLILHMEELHWLQKSFENWVLKGMPIQIFSTNLLMVGEGKI